MVPPILNLQSRQAAAFLLGRHDLVTRNIYVLRDVDDQLVHMKHINRKLLVLVGYEFRRRRGKRFLVDADSPCNFVRRHPLEDPEE